MEKGKKQTALIVLAIFTLIALVVGATYAFFAVSTTDNFGTSTINAQARSIASVTLTGTNATMEMDLTPLDMKQNNAGTFYASTTGKVKDPEDAVIVTLGTATVAPNDDTNYYHCSYTLSVSHDGDNDMYDLFNHQTNNEYDYENRSEGQIILTVNEEDYDWGSNTGMPSTIPGEFNIKAGSPVNIEASLKFINSSTIDQTYLAGSDISIEISVVANSLSCTVEEEPQQTISYWTYEGNYVLSPYAHKISDYRNLNVYKRTYGISNYAYLTESDCLNSIQGSETCSEVTQPYFIKETNVTSTSNEQINELLISDDNGSTYNTFGYYTISEYANFLTSVLGGAELTCNGTSTLVVDEDDGTLAKCVPHEPGYEFYTTTYETCANINGTVICLKKGDYRNSETIRGKFQSAGLICKYQNRNGGAYSNNKPSEGELKCSNVDPSITRVGGEFLCYIDSSGDVGCGIYNEAECRVEDEVITWCGN